jgi:hypothetical protein
MGVSVNKKTVQTWRSARLGDKWERSAPYHYRRRSTLSLPRSLKNIAGNNIAVHA